MNIVELVDKYQKMLTSSVTLNFLKVIIRTLKVFVRKIQSYLAEYLF